MGYEPQEYREKTSKLIKECRSAPKDVRISAFLNYCIELIDEKEKGNISIEQVGYNLTGFWLRVDLKDTICEPLCDLAGDMEIPRDAKYKNGADTMKEKEWQIFVSEVTKIKTERV